MNDTKNTDLGSGSIGKLLFKLSLPAIIAQLVNVLYNIVDRMFIGRLDNGDLAMAGIGVAFPIITLISAFSALIGNGGDLAVGAMAIMNSVMQIMLMPLMGLTMGAQPILSYNYGANKMDRVGKTFKLLLASCITYTVLIGGTVLLFPEFYVSIFNDKPELVEITSWCMRIFFIGTLIFGGQIACQQTFLSLGKAKISLILALLRKIILLVPLTFILPVFFENKLLGTLVAEPVADIVATLTTVICFSIFYKKLIKNHNKLSKENK
ncbi:MAG: Mate efflux family protein [Clostridium butyricum DORA_1]|nr:MAG: Mate efflux family protein [Clostridium butyricum DORA_1]MDU1507747.1 MATE family efflux transporter [Clostridium butyricum]